MHTNCLVHPAGYPIQLLQFNKIETSLLISLFFFFLLLLLPVTSKIIDYSECVFSTDWPFGNHFPFLLFFFAHTKDSIFAINVKSKRASNNEFQMKSLTESFRTCCVRMDIKWTLINVKHDKISFQRIKDTYQISNSALNSVNEGKE